MRACSQNQVASCPKEAYHREMEPLEQRLASLEAKIDELLSTITKIKRAFYWTIGISIAVVVLPLIGLFFAIPSFLSTYSGISDITGGF